MSTGTPEQVLKSIVDGINTGDLDALMTLYEPEAAFASQPGSLAHGLPGVRESLAGFIAMRPSSRRRPASDRVGFSAGSDNRRRRSDVICYRIASDPSRTFEGDTPCGCC